MNISFETIMSRLARLSLQDLQTLKELYASDRVRNVATINAIINIVDRIKKTPDLAERVEFLSLGDSWKKDGTLVIKNDSRIYFNTLQSAPYKNIKSALDQIEIKDEITFASISDRFRGILKDFLWYNNLETTFEQGTVGYYLPRELILNMPDKPLPENYELRPLTAAHIDEINRENPREGGDNLNYVKTAIENKETLALFEKSSGKLVGFVLAMDFCSAGMIVIKDGTKRNGLGTIMGSIILKKLAKEKNMDLSWHGIHGHPVTHHGSRRLGAKPFDTLTWLTARRKEIPRAARYGLFQLVY